MFGAFILLCGTTHLLSIWVLWHPNYWFEGILKALTAAVSLFTAIALVKLIPQALSIPSRLQLEEERERRIEILEAMTDGFFTLDEDWKFTYLNKRSLEIMGITESELVGRNVWEIFPHESNRGFREKYEEAIATKQKIRFEEYYQPFDSWFDVTACPISGGGLGILFVNVTANKRQEEGLRNALASSQELVELKSQIVTTLSHEYRTPLATILSSAELLERHWDNYSRERGRSHISRILRSVHYLNALITDVLLLAKAESGKLELELSWIVLKPWLSEIAEEVTGERVIRIDAQEADLAIFVDEILMRQAMINLLSNAIKYSSAESEVVVSIEKQEERALIRITDRGIGIPAGDLGKIFDSFQRGSNVELVQGTGVGLALVKKCVDLHKGNVRVESEVGVGTTFTVCLPIIDNSNNL